VTAVLGIGASPVVTLGGAGAVPPLDVLRPLDTDVDQGAFLDAAAYALETHGTVIALYPTWGPPDTRRQIHVARSALETTDLVPMATALPPLAAAVLANMVARLADRVGPGALLAGQQCLEAELVVLAWLGSVAKLERPSPSLRQHLQSWLPHTGFAVSVQPRPSVHRITPVDLVGLPLPGSFAQATLVVAARDLTSNWVREVLIPRFGPASVVAVEATSAGPTWWGTTRLVEVVAAPTDLDVLGAFLISRYPCVSCEWCGRLTHGRSCPFCGMQQSRPLLGSAA
jgi:hypothetical protein